MRIRIATSLALATAFLLLSGCAATGSATGAMPSATATLPVIPTELYVVANTANVTSLERDAHAITTIGIDGVTVSAAGNAVSKLPDNAAALVAAAHSRGLTAELLVSNYDDATGDFSPKIATALLGSSEHRSAVIADLVTRVTDGGFDGVQIELESLGADDSPGLVSFTTQLHDSLGAPRSVSLAVMAASSPSRYRDAGYDFALLTPQLARVVLMAYDQYGPTRSKPGPVGGLPWTTEALDALIAAGVPTARIDLGIAGYGYSWPGNGSDGKQLSGNDSRALAGDLGRWDPREAEWTATLPDDTVVWWSDSRSLSARHSLALSRNLHGLAVWELLLTDPLQAPIRIRSAGQDESRPCRQTMMAPGVGRDLTGIVADTLESTQEKVDRMTDSGELSEPVQGGSGDATREQKIAGLARQVAADLILRPQEDLLSQLRLRLFDAGITVDENELIAIAGTVALGEQTARLLAGRAPYSGMKNLQTDLLVTAERFYDQ